ncbi:MAG: RNA polymerase sigma-54 factor, partial [Planctomycetota bacterium]
MRLSLGQQLKQVQKQILAPRMIQSMEILQLPILELEARIEQELMENPTLELREQDPDLPEQRDEDTPERDDDSERELVISEDENHEEDFERLSALGEEWDEVVNEQSQPSRNRVEEAGERYHDTMANAPAQPQTLQDYLCDQLAWFDLADDLRAMAERIINNLDENGYLQTSLDDLLGPEATDDDRQLAEQALQVVQKLDPPGVGARNLAECLLLQVRPGDPYEHQLRQLIQEHLEDLEHNRLPLIAKKMGLSIETLDRVINELRRLNPKPGAAFSETRAPLVTPDVYVEEDESGNYQVRLEDGRTPQLRISPYYRRLISRGQLTPEAKEYLKKKLTAAQWMVDAIEQRRNTLLKVAQAVVDHQRRFLKEGPAAIEPLKMQQIADRVGVHVTTVSRAVDDKWIQTPQGIFPLRRFFVSGTTDANGEEVAWDVIRMKLQEIIDNEDRSNPFTDDQLVQELEKQGVKVARRTVTKYRKIMGIPS